MCSNVEHISQLLFSSSSSCLIFMMYHALFFNLPLSSVFLCHRGKRYNTTLQSIVNHETRWLWLDIGFINIIPQLKLTY